MALYEESVDINYSQYKRESHSKPLNPALECHYKQLRSKGKDKHLVVFLTTKRWAWHCYLATSGDPAISLKEGPALA